MRKLILFALSAMLVMTACQRQPKSVIAVSTERIVIDSTKDATQDKAYLKRLAPTKAVLDKEMGVQIGYAPQNLWIASPECPLLNWATDVLWEAAKQAYPGKVDIAIANMGGIRNEWPAGPITVGMVYKLMPFDNQLVVLSLKGSDIIALCESFAQYGAQGVAGMKVVIKGKKLMNVTVGGKPVNPKAIYTVATSDYLSGGTDHMTALTHHVDYWNSELLIRELYLSAVQTQDTIRAAVDGRMTMEP